MAPGAYLWWYLDALSDDGRQGLSIIAFVGSVFSPYYRRAFARGQADAQDHCAINVALYGQGHKRWTMTERGCASLQRDAHSFSVGPSQLVWDGESLTVEIDEIAVPLPRRVRGRVRLWPQGLCTFNTVLDAQGRHRWGPIAPCARAEVQLESPPMQWRGHAYFDSNEGDEPIERAFLEWDWSRAELRDGSTAVIYDVRPAQGGERVIAQRFASDGSASSFDPPPRQRLPRTGWRLERTMRSDAAVPARVLATFEDTPFYARSKLESGLFGQRVVSMHETLNIPRLVSPPVQWMLPWRMPRRA